MGKRRAAQTLYGIGEWYGKLLTELGPVERKLYAHLQTMPKRDREPQVCPFRSKAPDRLFPCKKEGGVCSLRQYAKSADGVVTASEELVTTCPNRFLEGREIFRWIGQTLLGMPTPHVLGQIGFLQGVSEEKSGDVGRIDHVLVAPDADPLRWCAMEIQSVYFQGTTMTKDFRGILNSPEDIFPAARRQPDYRSSGPKRLLPQLQIKVPTLRRWGKKMAVVVDRAFFNAMAQMDTVAHVSNCDIAWFVVNYHQNGPVAELVRDEVYFTTLERSVEGLTAGVPVDLPTFESRLVEKLGGMLS